jgi:glucosylceramidase
MPKPSKQSNLINHKLMKHFLVTTCLAFFTFLISACESGKDNPPDVTPAKQADAIMYVTSADKSRLFDSVALFFNTKPNMDIASTITLNPAVTYQQIDGFGAAITGSTCYNLLRMSEADRSALLHETFDTTGGAGYSYIRISIGASDFSLEEYTWWDTPGIENFKMHEYDRRDLIPILKELLAINPKLKIMGSPWSCPRWMKVNNLTDLQPYNSWTSGQLNPAYYQEYATYFVKFIQAMEEEGIPIESITIQNEPLNRGNSMSLYMAWQEQADFIKNALGPRLEEAGLQTKVVIFDHNYNYDNIADQMDYPKKIYAIPEAAAYIDGAAFHAYGGDKAELLDIQQAAPGKNLYFTEMSIGSWNYTFDGDLIWSMRELGIGTLNNYNKAVIVWNFLLDENGAPNRPGGCTTCYGAVEISSSDYRTLDRKSHFYVIAHLSKTFAPGSTRIAFNGFEAEGLSMTAVENIDGTFGVVLLNENNSQIKITIEDGNHSFPLTIPPQSIASCRWKK